MARMDGPAKPGLLARVAYWMCRRRIGRVVAPIRIHAHHPRLLRGLAGMEMAQEAAKSVDPLLKALVQLLAAQRIGCPF